MQAQIDDGTRKTINGIGIAGICLGVAGIGLGAWLFFGAGMTKQGASVAIAGATLVGLGALLIQIAAHLLAIGVGMLVIVLAGLAYLIWARVRHVQVSNALTAVVTAVEAQAPHIADSIKAGVVAAAGDAAAGVKATITAVKHAEGIIHDLMGVSEGKEGMGATEKVADAD